MAGALLLKQKTNTTFCSVLSFEQNTSGWPVKHTERCDSQSIDHDILNFAVNIPISPYNFVLGIIAGRRDPCNFDQFFRSFSVSGLSLTTDRPKLISAMANPHFMKEPLISFM